MIADVAGKGVPAAILMAFLRASLRAATHIGYATNISMSKVNYLLWESIERNQFVTAFHAVLDASRTLSYSNAGHNPPLLINAKGEARFIEHGEQPLGMFPATRYHRYHLLLEPGDVLVLYTDGATEAESPAGEEFGRDRLAQAVKDHYEQPAREMIASLQMAILEWTDQQGANDDVTFFIIKAPEVTTISTKDARKQVKIYFASLRLCVKVREMLVCGQRAMGVITARCERSTIVAKVKLSFGLR